LLAGVPPYDATGDEARWEHIVLNQEPPSMWRAVSTTNPTELANKRSVAVARFRRDLSGDLDVIVHKALKKRPEERYPTVAALADDIRRYLQDEPVLAQRDSNWYRMGKFVHRNRLAAGAAAAVIVALGVGLATTLWQLQVAQAERRRAEEVKEFIASTFRAADPFFTGKKSMTTIELLALARQRIDQQLTSQPENAVELLNIVGESQANLDQHDAAKATFNKAIALAEGLKPPDELQIAEAQAWLAGIARMEGDQASVVPLLDKAVPVLRKHQPRSGRTLSMALSEQAFVKFEEDKIDDAIALSHQSVDAVNAALGPTHTETLIAKRNLALFYVLARRFDAAKP
ncbi:MAG TPA: hypothetical protein VFX76_17505, partial [Roseiflexaceae bacterium]|nr:hypothetical protein [Roseiflexaceae bacterium]